ncbi:MAG: hypothetical protein KME46_21740 [Brasilonema angustatum HA4187-MV1]|jgi:hypothetical protein|nr:hypothetical protein [Brasilonema angustatum HA4187-MV1]
MQSFALAAELFVVVFSFICWLTYVPTETTDMSQTINQDIFQEQSNVVEEIFNIVSSEIKESNETSLVEETTSNETYLVEKITSNDSTTIDIPSPWDETLVIDSTVQPTLVSNEQEHASIYQRIENLTLVQARQIASKLREMKMIAPDTKLSGKGIGKKYLVELISERIFEHKEAIAEIIDQIIEQTVIS